MNTFAPLHGFKSSPWLATSQLQFPTRAVVLKLTPPLPTSHVARVKTWLFTQNILRHGAVRPKLHASCSARRRFIAKGGARRAKFRMRGGSFCFSSRLVQRQSRLEHKINVRQKTDLFSKKNRNSRRCRGWRPLLEVV